jgi:hypothetical protein
MLQRNKADQEIVVECERNETGRMEWWTSSNEQQMLTFATDAVWRDEFPPQNHVEQPWGNYHVHQNNWQKSLRDLQHFSAGILWLLVVRGALVQCLRARYRSERMNV